MKKISEIFSKEELQYITAKKPNLVPMDVPFESDANILNKPSVDQVIIKFLEQYEVNVKPRNVGDWNGWDTAATLGILLSRESGAGSIASSIFASNKSNQVNSAAQDWGTWKRWALDHKNFDQFKKEVFENIELHNKKEIDKINREINNANKSNKRVKEALRDPVAKNYVSELTKKNEKIVRNRTLAISGSILLFITFISVQDNISGADAARKQKRREESMALVRKAKSYYENGDFYEGKDTYNDALIADPTNADVVMMFFGISVILNKFNKDYYDCVDHQITGYLLSYRHPALRKAYRRDSTYRYFYTEFCKRIYENLDNSPYESQFLRILDMYKRI